MSPYNQELLNQFHSQNLSKEEISITRVPNLYYPNSVNKI